MIVDSSNSAGSTLSEDYPKPGRRNVNLCSVRRRFLVRSTSFVVPASAGSPHEGGTTKLACRTLLTFRLVSALAGRCRYTFPFGVGSCRPLPPRLSPLCNRRHRLVRVLEQARQLPVCQ